MKPDKRLYEHVPNRRDVLIVGHAAFVAGAAATGVIGIAAAGEIDAANSAWGQSRLGAVSQSSSITPEMFMEDGKLNDGGAIGAANRYCESKGLPLKFQSRVYDVGTSSFVLDVSRTNWICDGQATLKWSAPPTSGAGVTIIGAGRYSDRFRQDRVAMAGIALLGGVQGATFQATGLQIGDGSPGHTVSHAKICLGAIQGFANALHYTDHAYFIEIEDFQILWGTITTPEVASDFGENMVLRHCFVADVPGDAVQLQRGEWKLLECSLDNATLRAMNDAFVVFENGHMENPGSESTTPRFLDMGGEACVVLRGTWFVIDRARDGRAITAPVIRCDATSLTAGLDLDGCVWVQGGHFDPLLGGHLHRSLCEGQGRVSARLCSVMGWGNKYFTSIGTGAQCLANGDFESGTTHGWTRADAGLGNGKTGFVVDTASKAGRHCGKIEASWRNGGNFGSTVKQFVRVDPGNIVVGGIWHKSDISNELRAKHIPSIALRWVDDSEETLGIVLFDSASSAEYSYCPIGGIAPAGTIYVSLEISVLADAQHPQLAVWIDEALINILR